MARAMITSDRITSAGLMNPTYDVIGVDGVEFANTGNEIVHIKAPSAATITIVTSATVAGLEIADKTISLGIGEEVFLADLDKKYYNTGDGTVYIDSDVTDTEILIFRK